MGNGKRKEVWTCEKLQRCSGILMWRRIKEKKGRKAGGMAGSWGIWWSRKSRGMMNEAVATNGKANVEELEQSFEKLETYGWFSGTWRYGECWKHEQLQISRIRSSCEPGDQRSQQVFRALPFVYIAVWMGGEAVPTAWDRGTVFLTVWDHSVQQPSHSSHCVDKAGSSLKPQEGLKIYIPHKNWNW